MFKRYTILALVIIAVLSIPLLAIAQSERSEPRQALTNVSLNSRPEWAEVKIDGAFVGTTPIQYRLAPGVHQIEMSRNGFQTWSRELTVSNVAPANVTALLEENGTKPCPK